jgi:hypothetical protein
MPNPGNVPGDEQQPGEAGDVDKRRAKVRKGRERRLDWQLMRERMRQRGGR